MDVVAKAHRGQDPLALSALVAGILLTWSPRAFALNPALDVSQYAHTPWKTREGFTKGIIRSIAQTPDGYLWLGTEFGLLRFDGVRNVPFQPPQDRHLPSEDITSLVAARDGTLWIGSSKGLASWNRGKLTDYAELSGQFVFRILEDRQGAIWVGTVGLPDGRLYEVQNGKVRRHFVAGGFSIGVFGLHADEKGNLWVGGGQALWRWKPDPPEVYQVSQPNGIQGMTEDQDGALLIAMTGGVGQLVDGKLQIVYPFRATMRKLQSDRLFRDRQGSLWVGTLGGGIVHVHQGRTDVFSQSDGLTGNSVHDFFEDREGSIWVATNNGLDRFRELPVVTYGVNEGLLNVPSGALLAARDGSMWFGNRDGLNRLNNGQVTVYRDRSDRGSSEVREIADSALPDQALGSLLQDSRERIWVSSRSRVGYLENGRFVSTRFPGGIVTAVAEDTSGAMWIANLTLGLFRLSPANELQQFPWTTFGRKDPARPVVADPLRGGVWLGFFDGGIAWFRDGRIRASYSVADGLGEGRVNDLRFDREGALWTATDGGLSRLKDGRIATLTSKNGLPCNTVHWSMEDEVSSVWLYMPCGLVRIVRSELDAWAAAPDKADRTIHPTVFDSSDGVTIAAQTGSIGPRVAKSPDGRLWFLIADGISVVDPRRLPFNKLAPPVYIEQITADRKIYPSNAGLRLPPLVRDLQIHYTALSLVDSEKVRFRYKLEGRDRDWQDAGTRRQVFYNDLSPRSYRFRVTACNNSGVWNEAGASFDFSVDPTYYQTTWFHLSCTAGFLALLWALYQLRLRQMAKYFNIRMEERVNERTRIARDLHDTLLQSFQAALLKFHAITYLIGDRPEARNRLSAVIEEARKAVTEGRDAIQGLRSSMVVTNDLAEAISTLAGGLAADQTGQNSAEFCLHVEGTTRDLVPLIRDEVYRIACEALRNAFLHAHAGRIEVEIRYDRRQFRVRIRDDGQGIDPKILEEGGSAGHHGLPGIQERAKLVEGKLAVYSGLDSGTEVELTIPAAIAYAKSRAVRWLVSGKGN